ncbi:MAG TPA: TRAP transporter large permease [Dehalococcoidales bacterium]|nr:MAG: C4-dicarboxylate ABC transporter permease [Chloroflexi bacterium RBG_16_60_22]HJX13985.1 TRAP transporter large permease [Dehalococcoidales bacterium]
MTPLAAGVVGVGVLLVLLFSRMPIGFVMGLVGFAGFAYLAGFEGGLGVLRTVVYSTFADYGLSVIPLFILMGSFCFYAGLSKDLYDTVHRWLGQFRGGLAMATVGACAGFAAISGSSLATAATMGTVALPEMKRYNYDDRLATGAVAAGGTIGILIPPSVILILYGVITEQSIGKLFLAGFIPGVLEAVFYMVTIYIMCRSNPQLGPPAPRTSFIEKITSLKNTWIVLALFVLVIGGIYLGVFSPTEAAGVGAFGAFIFGLARRRLGWKAFKDSLVGTGRTTAMIFVIILGAMVLGYFLAISRMPFVLADYVGALAVNRYVILVLVLLVYLVLGCVMDSLAIMLLITPIFFPLIISLGFNPIWFGILTTRATEIGLITPPVGLNVYVIRGVAGDVPIGTIFRGIVPFLIADIFEVALLISVPQLSLFLPGFMK